MEIATLIRQNKHEQAPEWPEVALVGQPSIYPIPSGLSSFDTFRTTYNSLCVCHSIQPSTAALLYVENLHSFGDRDFAVHDIPGADWNSVGEKDALLGPGGLIPVIHALRYDRYFWSLSAFNIPRRELVFSLAQVMRTNSALVKLQLCNNDADSSSLTELALAMKENRNLRLQRIEISDHKNMDHRTTHVLSSMITTFPIPRLSHLNLARCGLPGKGLTKLFQAFQLNWSISLGISHLNLSGAKFDSDTVAALELWLELGGNYSHLKELVLSDMSNLPYKVLPKFKACTKLNKLVLSNNKLDSSSDMKFVAQLLMESPALRRINFSSCGIEKATTLDSLLDAVKKMKCDDIELNLSSNSGPATEAHWISILKECKIKALHLANVHFKDTNLEWLLNCLKSLPSLKVLTLDDSKTKLRNPEVSLLLLQSPALETLSLSNALDDASMLTLIDGITCSNKSITSLDISFNNLGDDLGNYLIKLIHQNPHIKKLNCDGNGMSYTCWHGVFEALRSANAGMHTVQYPHADVAALSSWANTIPRQSSLAKKLLNMHEVLRSVTILTEEGKQGSLSPADLSVAEKWETPTDALPAAPIPSHLASQHTEMKLDDLGDWTVPTVGTPPADFASGSVSSASGSSLLAAAAGDVASPPGGRAAAVRNSTSSSLRRPSAVDIFPNTLSSPVGSPVGRISPSSSSTSLGPSNAGTLAPNGAAYNSTSPPVSPRGATGSVSAGNKPPLPGMLPKLPAVKLPGLSPIGPNGSPHSRSASVTSRPTPAGAGTSTDGRPPVPGALPAHLRGLSLPGGASSLSSSSSTAASANGSGDDFGISSSSSLTFGSYGQVDEEIDAEEPVRRATLNEMVIRLAHESSSDVKFMHTFLLTYRATVEPAELLDRLITRFFSKPPKGADVKVWFDTTLRPIRLRVMNVLKRWCEAHWQDFANDSGLIATLEAFLKDGTVMRYHETSASALLSFIHKQLQVAHQKVVMTGTLRSRFDPDSVEMSPRLAADDQASGMIGVLSKYSSEEIADQMCLLESDLFQSLQIKEFFNQGWNKGSNEQKDAAAPNIRLMIRVSNQITTWIAYEVLRQPTASARSKALSKAISIAVCLTERNNFNGLKEITAGLALSSVQRLKKAWIAVKPKLKQAYNDLTSNVDNMQSMRQLAHKATPPLVPYLGVYLTDLVFIEDGNPNTFEEDGSTFINFRKMSILGEVLMEISSYQQERYVVPKMDELYNYLLTLESHPDNELYQLSIAAEPKKK